MRRSSGPKVILISGPPGAGKSTIAADLSSRLALPVLAKDAIKESLLDDLGYADRARSVEIGYAAFQLHLKLARELAQNDVSFIYETAFYSQSAQDIASALAGTTIIQAWVHASIEKMLDRARTRVRHPGHADWYDGYEQECREKLAAGVYNALDIGGILVDVDTNSFEAPQYQRALQEIVDAYHA